jgi:hypothetical protein
MYESCTQGSCTLDYDIEPTTIKQTPTYLTVNGMKNVYFIYIYIYISLKYVEINTYLF